MTLLPPPMAGIGFDQPMVYEIRCKGRLGSRWDGWFDHMTIVADAKGNTRLTGPIVDQAALHGVLTRVRDLGLTLISIMVIDPHSPGTSHATTHEKEHQ